MSGVHNVPSNYTQAVATVAYKIPDIEGTVTIQLYNASNPSQQIGCFSSSISNGVSTDISAVKFLTIGLAAAALVISGISSATNSPPPAPVNHIPVVTGTEGSAGTAPPVSTGVGTGPAAGPGTNVAAGGFHAPGFIEFFSVLQSIAISGMYSVNYPESYRRFTQNVAWSAGAITWAGMQQSIDDFRGRTGGNLTMSSYTKLKETTLIMGNQTNQVLDTQAMARNQSATTAATAAHRLIKRAVATIVNNSTTSSTANSTTSESPDNTKKYVEIVSGVKAYIESMLVPNTNIFMTMLIWWAIIVGICVAGIMGFKLFLELWFLHKKDAQKFSGFRKRYLVILNTTLVRIIALLYGVWVLYCLHQFKISDSWGVKLLAGLTLGLFSLVLIGYGLRICYLAHKAIKKKELDFLFQHKPWIRKYGLFYDQFKVKFWWAFIPVFLCSFGRNAFLALGYGNGLVQVIGQLVIDVILCSFLAICMPFNTKMGNGINLSIQVVRVISLVFLLVFTVQANVNRIAVTGVGMALIVIQALLAIVLALLIFANAVIGLTNMLRSDKKKKKKEQKKGEEGLANETDDESNHQLITYRTLSNSNLPGSRDEKQTLDYEYNSFSVSEPSTSDTLHDTHNKMSEVSTNGNILPLELLKARSNSTNFNKGGLDTLAKGISESSEPSSPFFFFANDPHGKQGNEKYTMHQNNQYTNINRDIATSHSPIVTTGSDDANNNQNNIIGNAPASGTISGMPHIQPTKPNFGAGKYNGADLMGSQTVANHSGDRLDEQYGHNATESSNSSSSQNSHNLFLSHHMLSRTSSSSNNGSFAHFRGEGGLVTENRSEDYDSESVVQKSVNTKSVLMSTVATVAADPAVANRDDEVNQTPAGGHDGILTSGQRSKPTKPDPNLFIFDANELTSTSSSS